MINTPYCDNDNDDAYIDAKNIQKYASRNT